MWPQVVWGFAGERPQTLPANIRIYNWIPQNDLLGESILPQFKNITLFTLHSVSPVFVKFDDFPPFFSLFPRKGHPKTKAFITHGGSNGLYEAIYHGVPLVGIPLFADQPDNIFILEKKGVAVNLDLYHMDSDDLVEGLRTVINNPL